MIGWLSDNYIEVLGAITGLIYLYFSYHRKVWLWPFGIITSALYVIFFRRTHLYADMSLQVYYVLISIYGWYFWLWGKKNHDEKQGYIRIRSINLKMWIILVSITAILTIVSGFLLKKYTDASLPYWDAFTTAGGIVATWMLARKLLENWLFWIVVDFIATGIYFYKEKYPTVILYMVFTIIAIAGYYKWKRDMEKT